MYMYMYITTEQNLLFSQLTWAWVSAELSNFSEANAGEVGQSEVSAGVVVTLHDVKRKGASVASYLPYRDCRISYAVEHTCTADTSWTKDMSLS